MPYSQGLPIHEAEWGGCLRQQVSGRHPPQSAQSPPLLLLPLPGLEKEEGGEDGAKEKVWRKVVSQTSIPLFPFQCRDWEEQRFSHHQVRAEGDIWHMASGARRSWLDPNTGYFVHPVLGIVWELPFLFQYQPSFLFLRYIFYLCFNFYLVL